MNTEKSLARKVLDIAWYVVVMLMIQLAAALVYARIDHSSRNLVVVEGVAALVTILIFALMKWSPVSRTYLRSRPWGVLAWIVVLAFGLVLPAQGLQDALGLTMDDAQADALRQLISEPAGFLVLCILAPLSEEMVMRGAVLRSLLKLLKGKSAWVAIVLSAMIFGALHGNVAQMVNATLMGLLLGWMYWRSGSIVPGLVFHCVNNTIAWAVSSIYPHLADATLVEMFGGSTSAAWKAVGFSLLIALPALYQVAIRLKRPAATDDSELTSRNR